MTSVSKIKEWMRILGLSKGWYRDKLNEWDSSPQSDIIWEDLAEQVDSRKIENIEDFLIFMEKE